LIRDEARNQLATYPSLPDFKAIAISADGYGTAMGARDASAASAEALDRCKAASKPTAYCRLYAVGNDVVWSAKSLALPLPFDIHAEPLEDAFNVAELPLNIPGQADVITKAYGNKNDHRVLALLVTPQVIGRYLTITGAQLLSSAVRRATEQCADVFYSPCLIVSVDGFWTVRVPKSVASSACFCSRARRRCRTKTGSGSGRPTSRKTGVHWRGARAGAGMRSAGPPRNPPPSSRRCIAARNATANAICMPSAISSSRTTSSAQA